MRGRHLRRIGIILVVSIAVAGSALLLFEALYRVQLIDTYAPELLAYNPAATLAATDTAPTALLLGDSFTAGSVGGYAADLRGLLPGARIVNAGISGTGVLQAGFVARERFRRFRPKVLLYQVYVGNDLFDIRYPVNWRKVSFARNAYWMISNQLRSLAFVNYRLGQFRFEMQRGPEQQQTPPDSEQFSVANYDPRVKTYFQAEPGLVESSIRVQGDRARDFSILVKRMHYLLAHCVPGKCSAYVLVIPHCVQVSKECLANYQALGAQLDDSLAVESPEYPFIAQLTLALQDVKNANVLNPLSMLRAATASGQAVYKANDEHLNARGNQLLAGFLAPTLARSLDLASASTR